MQLQRNSPTFGNDLLMIRLKLKMSRHQFAKKLGMSSSDSIRRYEEDGVKPQMDIFIRICSVLNEEGANEHILSPQDMSTQDLLMELTSRGFKVTLEEQR